MSENRQSALSELRSPWDRMYIPSRKRGPAKGYLTDLELKLHQMEALLGVILGSKDPRAVSLVNDMSRDSAARDILSRVDVGFVGTQPPSKGEAGNNRTGNSSVGKRIASELAEATREWQRHLDQIIRGKSTSPQAQQHSYVFARASDRHDTSNQPLFTPLEALSVPERQQIDTSESRSSSPSRRKRPEPLTPLTMGSPGANEPNRHHSDRVGAASVALSGRETPDYSDSEDLHDALGQLSLDDASQIRYHGKASGLHLLGQTERVDRRAEGGIWRFPPARVWPPLERPIEKARALFASDFGVQLPTIEQQRHLLDTFFTYINPSLPLFDRESFMRAWSLGIDESSESPPVPTFIPTRLPLPLMLVIFSIAMRISLDISKETAEGTMSSTGDEYLSAAKYMMTANPYAASRPATSQAYLLIAYREIGIGAMSQAWLFLGVAIRMAQDLGLHRSVDKFHTIASNMFSATEKEARNRMWWCCVVLDRYISTYIGRPCMIFERDYDTPLPVEFSSETEEIWNGTTLRGDGISSINQATYTPTRSHTIACLRASARLSSILGRIVETLYSVKQVVPSRHHEASRIEELLDGLFLELPPYLKVDLSAGAPTQLPPPHILAFNMQYWNAVLLLHRPFINRRVTSRRDSPDPVNSPADSDIIRASAARASDMCKIAANNVSVLAQAYRKAFCLRKCSPFLCYYVFSAAVMHVALLNQQQPENVSKLVNSLQECMDTLRGISTLWPSAGRGWELINGCRSATRRPFPVQNIAHTGQRPQDDNLYSGRASQNQARGLSHAKSMSHVGGERQNLHNSLASNRVGQFHYQRNTSFQPSQPLQSPASILQGYEPQSQFASFSAADPNNARTTFIQPSPTHSRSASVASHREPATAPMPHFWSDPFTDSTLLSSNYYGLQGMDRQTQVALDRNTNSGFPQFNFTPFDNTQY
ncbi:hypothetical protein FRC18_008823 [Serendipita sp. 400]|nr:hypothetical protein FRC18_008823 [Serendipita sp. 400]